MLFIHELRYLLQMPKLHRRRNLSNFQSYGIHRASKITVSLSKDQKVVII